MLRRNGTKRRNSDGCPPLWKWNRVKSYNLTLTTTAVLNGLAEHKTQAQLARELGISKSAVCQAVKRLTTIGIAARRDLTVGQNHRLNFITRGGQRPNYDVRWRSLKWKLKSEVKLPYVREALNKGVKLRSWNIHGCGIKTYTGKCEKSIEITAGYQGGSTPDEATRLHDHKVLTVWRWLREKYPALKQVGELDYTVNRAGELNVEELKGYAEAMLKEYGVSKIMFGNPPIAKIDDSMKNGGEFQLLMGNIATKEDMKNFITKDDFKEMMDKLATKEDIKHLATKEDIHEIQVVLVAMHKEITTMSENTAGMVQLLKRLVSMLSGEPAPEVEKKELPPPDGNSYV